MSNSNLNKVKSNLIDNTLDGKVANNKILLHLARVTLPAEYRFHVGEIPAPIESPEGYVRIRGCFASVTTASGRPIYYPIYVDLETGSIELT